MALKLTTQAGLLAASRAAGQLLNAVAGFVLVRFLTQEDFGTFRQLTLLFSTLVVLVDLGLTESLYYFIPRAPARRAVFMRQTVLVVTLLQIAVGAVLVLGGAWIGAYFHNSALPNHLLLLSISLGLSAITRLWEVELVAEQRVPMASLVSGAGETVKVALMMASLALGPSVERLLWAMALGAALKMAAFLWFIGRDLRWFAGVSADAESNSQFGYSLVLWAPAIVNTLAIYAHQYIVGNRFTPAEFAIYSTACFQVPFLGALTTSIIEVMLVRVTAARAQGNYDEVKRTWNSACTKAMLVFLPMAVGLAVVATPLMAVLFGAPYAAAGPLFVLLVAGLPLHGLFTDNMLRAYGAMRSYAGFYAARLVLGLVLGIAGVVWFGMAGVALSTTLTMLLVRGWQLRKVARLLQVDFAHVLPWRALARIALACALAAVPAALCAILIARPVFILLTALPVFVLAYFLLALRFGLFAPVLAAADFRRRRVMLFTDSFIHGGTERQLVEALRRLDRGKYEITVGCLKKRGPFLADIQALGLPIVEIPLQSFFAASTMKWFFWLVEYFRENRVDVVHAFDFYTAVFVVPAARLAGVPVVLASRRELAGDRTPWQQRALRVACWLATAIVANSRAAGSRLTGFRDALTTKVTVIPNSIDLDAFRPERSPDEVRRELGVGQAPLVGLLAALRLEKDIPTFLRAAAEVHRSVPTARFLLIGDGEERARLLRLAAELGIAQQTIFAGDRRDVPALLTALDVFVLSSTTESFPNAVLEAMAAGRPVVATDVGGIPELVEDAVTGYLVAPGDTVEMSQRIWRLLQDPAECRRMGAAGRARVAREFTPAKMKQRLEALYDRMLRIHRPAARILQIGNYPPPVCGWAIHTQLVERELADRGADSRVMDIGPARRVAGRGCIPVHNGLDYFAKLLYYRAKGFTFQVHLNGDSWKGFALAASAALLGAVTAKPAVLTFHAGPSQQYFPRTSGFWYHAFRVLFRSCGEVICNHEPVKKLIQAYGVAEENIHPIPAFSTQYAEEIPVPLPAEVEQFVAASSPLLFSYSMFRPEFTMPALFAGFAALRRAHPRAGLLVAGPPEIPAVSQEQLRQLGIEGAVLFPGNMPHAEFLTAVSRSSVFVRTHLRDGVCSSVLEALQLGVPVLAAEDGIRPPSVITYAPGDAADLEQKLLRVLADLAAARAHVRPPEITNNLQTEIALLLEAGRALPHEAGG